MRAKNNSFLSITRRDLLAYLSAIGVTAFVSCSDSKDRVVSSAEKKKLNIFLPENNDSENPSFDVFLALSKIITVREKLDNKIAQKIYQLILGEPWGKHHISSSYQILSKALLEPETPNFFLDTGQKWFTSHLLTTWYLGVYYHAERPTVRVTYEKSLMFDAVHHSFPIPVSEPVGYESWNQSPTPELIRES